MGQKKLYTISLNLDREKHRHLIEWLKRLADDEEHSLSSLCINLLKSCYKEMCNENGKSNQGL